jgi:hypothetical protein
MQPRKSLEFLVTQTCTASLSLFRSAVFDVPNNMAYVGWHTKYEYEGLPGDYYESDTCSVLAMRIWQEANFKRCLTVCNAPIEAAEVKASSEYLSIY